MQYLSKKNKKNLSHNKSISKNNNIKKFLIKNNFDPELLNYNNKNNKILILNKSASINKNIEKKNNSENIELTPKSIYPNYLEIRDIIIDKDSKTDNYLFRGDKIIFNKSGLGKGLRGKKDGFGFFGMNTYFHGKIVNDYNINVKKNNPNNEAIIYFSIYYDLLIKSFCFSPIHKINHDNIVNFDFELSIYQKLVTNSIKISKDIILNFDENKDHILCFQSNKSSSSLQILVFNINNANNTIKMDEQLLNTNNNISESFVSKSSKNINKLISIFNFDKNRKPFYIGISGDIKIDLNSNLYCVFYDHKENIWKIKHNRGVVRDFWIMCEKRIIIKCNDEYIFRINAQKFIINCFS